MDHRLSGLVAIACAVLAITAFACGSTSDTGPTCTLPPGFVIEELSCPGAPSDAGSGIPQTCSPSSAFGSTVRDGCTVYASTTNAHPAAGDCYVPDGSPTCCVAECTCVNGACNFQ